MSQQSGPEGGDKNAYALLWMLAGFAIVVLGIWYFFSQQLKMLFLWVRRYEALGIGFFTQDVNVVTQWLYSAQPEDVTKISVIKVSQFIGDFLMMPAIGLLAFMALYLFKTHVGMRYTKKYSIDTLAQQEQHNWPQIAPVVGLDLVSIDLDKGPWAMAMNPMQFSRHHKLLNVDLVPGVKGPWRQGVFRQATLLK